MADRIEVHSRSDMLGARAGPEFYHKYRNNSILSGLFVSSAGYYQRAGWHELDWRILEDGEYVFIYCLAGRGYYEVPDASYLIESGMLLVCLPGMAHRYGAHHRDPWTIRWMHLGGRELPQWLQRLEINEQQLVRYGLQRPGIAAAMMASLNLMRSGFNEAHLIDTAVHARLALSEMALALESQRGDRQRWRDFVVFIREHLQESLSLQEMATAADYSIAQLNRLCHQHSGMSPAAFHIHQRMQYAAELLLRDERSIQELALILGYEDPYYFSRLFKKVHGLSPRHFRSRQV